DDVRRETICGLRTPEQWVTRFTEDNSAYQTFRDPSAVVRVDGYEDLRTRLRIAVEADGEIVGELSVAEGSEPLGSRAEEALKVAATLAAPLMVRYARAADEDRVRQRRLLLNILHDGDAALKHAPALGLRLRDKWLLVGLRLEPSDAAAESARDIINERAARLLSLQLSFGEAAPTVTFDREIFYALLPVSSDAVRGLLCSRLETALAQLSQIGMDGYAAIGALSNDLRAVPASRADVDRLLRIGGHKGVKQSVLTIEDSWAELSMLSISDALGGNIERDCPPLAKLLKHDREHGSD